MAIKFTTSSIDTPSYNTWSIKEFNGVDYTTVPTSVDETRAIDASNYLPYGNALKKRNGWEMVNRLKYYDTYLKVYNIWKLKDFYVLYAYDFETDKLGFYYTRDLSDNNASLNIIGSNYQQTYDSTKIDTYSYGVVFENRLFILAMNEYYYFYISNNYLQCSLVSDVAYVPTVYKGINATGHNQSPTQVQEFNLLKNKAKASLIWYSPTPEELTFTYDLSSYFTSKSITSIEYTFGDTDYCVSNGTIYVDSNLEEIVGAISLEENIITIEYSAGYNEAWDDIRYINLEINFVNLDEDGNEIELTTIQKMRFGIAYGTTNYRDRLFLAGNPDYPNMDVHSLETNYDGQQSTSDAWLDYTYFGDNSYQLFGSSDYAITGYGIMSNGNMAIFKEPQQNMPNMYIRTASLVSRDIYYTDSNGDYVDSGQDEYVETYATTPIGVNVDTTTPNQVIMYGNDLLVNTPKGIYKIVTSSSTATQTYETVEMSYFIRNDIDNDISNSVFVIYDGKLYITRTKTETDSSGNEVKTTRIYVADYNRYSILNSNYIYEWWVLDGINASKFFVFNDTLYFVDDDRGLCKFGDSYRDMYRIDAPSVTINDTTTLTDIFINQDTNIITLSETSQIITDIKNKSDLQQAYKTFKNNSVLKFNDDYLAIKLDLDYTQLDINTYYENDEDEATTTDFSFYIKTSEDGDSYDISYLSVLFNYLKNNRYNVITYGSSSNKAIGVITEITSQTINDNIYLKITCNGNEISNESTFEFGDSSLYYVIPKSTEISIYDLYYVKGDYKYAFSKCTLNDDTWLYTDNGETIELGTIEDDIIFNHFTLKVNGEEIDFEVIGEETESGGVDIVVTPEETSNVSFTFYQPVESYWYCKYSDLGVLNYLKTADHITFLPDTRLGGTTNVGYRTSKYDVYFSSSRASSTFNFNDIDFDNFSFGGTDIAQSYSSRKKIKNFSFMQVRFSSSDETNSTIAELAVRYKVTKLSKGVR